MTVPKSFPKWSHSLLAHYVLEYFKVYFGHDTVCLGSALKGLGVIYIFKQFYLFHGHVRQGKYLIKKEKINKERALLGRPR